MKTKILVGALCMVASGCTMSPYDQCMAEKRGDMASYDAEIREAREQIQEAEQNLSRGYTIFESEVNTTTIGQCKVDGVTIPCSQPAKQKVEVPVPISPAAEQARIDRNSAIMERAMSAKEGLALQCQGLSRSV
ncbi:hypothetical protein HMH01_05800 [Halovulum dunhuangense]|uniref:Uncharacterized protein n=1 Tax=Halovulum dunhuangense TaxID=1505036 RepID=A0A849L150_9RHOB|nr:hypothetical protein [Halovulum dunhuangense]NNU79949.1 hypothetical protein [Halovulum dunhuangense]